MNIHLRYLSILSISVICSLITFSCTKYDNPPPVFEELKDLGTKQRKVIVISIDGVSGQTLKTLAPTNIMALQKQSKYSYSTLKTASDAGGWVSMLTGTGVLKHKIINDNFEADIEDSHEDHGSVTSYRNVLDYVTQYKSVKTALITPLEPLRSYMKNADFTPEVSSDLNVKDSTVNLISKERSLSTIFVSFRDAYNAGEADGFKLTNEKYKSAILKADEYINNITQSIKSRTNYANEDWLIIITTNIGGGNSDAGNGFTILHNPAFKEFELKKSGHNGVQFNPSTVFAEVIDDHGLYDAGATNDFTVQMDVKFNSTTQYPGFLSKSTNMSGNTFTGWLWMQSNANWNIVFGGSANGGTGKTQISGANGSTPINDGKWHTLTMVVKTTGGATPTARVMTAFLNGNQTITGNLLNNRSLSVLENLRVGYRSVDGGGTALNTNAANLAYFNVALDAETIKNNYNIKDITTHPNYENLIGYWPMDEGTEGTFYNYASNGYNMSLKGAYRWISMGENFPPGTIPENITSTLSIASSASDISALVLYWMNIEILSDFGFDGAAYLKNFEIEFLVD